MAQQTTPLDRGNRLSTLQTPKASPKKAKRYLRMQISFKVPTLIFQTRAKTANLPSAGWQSMPD